MDGTLTRLRHHREMPKPPRRSRPIARSAELPAVAASASPVRRPDPRQADALPASDPKIANPSAGGGLNGCFSHLEAERANPPPTQALKGRVDVRFRQTRHKALPDPAAYMHIDEAVDEIGKRRSPDVWGTNELWKTPFHRLPRSHYYRYRLVRIRDDFKLEFDLWKRIDDCDRNRLEVIDRTYKSARDELIRILSSNPGWAYKLFDDGAIASLGKVQHGLWSAQKLAIFYTGFGYDQRPTPRRFRVLLDRPNFEQWLEGGRLSPPASKAALKRLLPAIAQLIERRAREHKYRSDEGVVLVVQSELRKAGTDLSERKLQKAVWHDPVLVSRQGRGNPNSEMTGRRTADAEELRVEIAALIRREIDYGGN